MSTSTHNPQNPLNSGREGLGEVEVDVEEIHGMLVIMEGSGDTSLTGQDVAVISIGSDPDLLLIYDEQA